MNFFEVHVASILLSGLNVCSLNNLQSKLTYRTSAVCTAHIGKNKYKYSRQKIFAVSFSRSSEAVRRCQFERCHCVIIKCAKWFDVGI